MGLVKSATRSSLVAINPELNLDLQPIFSCRTLQ